MQRIALLHTKAASLPPFVPARGSVGDLEANAAARAAQKEKELRRSRRLRNLSPEDISKRLAENSRLRSNLTPSRHTPSKSLLKALALRSPFASGAGAADSERGTPWADRSDSGFDTCDSDKKILHETKPLRRSSLGGERLMFDAHAPISSPAAPARARSFGGATDFWE
jgi:hypothetical protein